MMIYGYKPKFHGNAPFPRNFLAANVMRKSVTCYENGVCVGRVTRTLRGCYEETAPVEYNVFIL